ncbi:hypothetical protein D8O06_21600 [Burkholderia mallei]|nr:hypothetical protein D8O06_21600 [Burkholderia mallei]
MPAVPARDYPRARRAANHPGATRGRASGIGRRASGVGRRASGARRPARARVIKSRSTRQRAAQAALARSSGRRTQRQTHC